LPVVCWNYEREIKKRKTSKRFLPARNPMTSCDKRQVTCKPIRMAPEHILNQENALFTRVLDRSRAVIFNQGNCSS
jgi:hypothetical protein